MFGLCLSIRSSLFKCEPSICLHMYEPILKMLPSMYHKEPIFIAFGPNWLVSASSESPAPLMWLLK